jgi:hypothetical protein
MLTADHLRNPDRTVVEALIKGNDFSATEAAQLVRQIKNNGRDSGLNDRRGRIATAVLSGMLANQNQVASASYLTSIVVRLAEDLIKELDK